MKNVSLWRQDNFQGGKNNAAPRHRIPEDTVEQVVNMFPGEEGEPLVLRGGFQPWSLSSQQTGVSRMIDKIRANLTKSGVTKREVVYLSAVDSGTNQIKVQAILPTDAHVLPTSNTDPAVWSLPTGSTGGTTPPITRQRLFTAKFDSMASLFGSVTLNGNTTKSLSARFVASGALDATYEIVPPGGTGTETFIPARDIATLATNPSNVPAIYASEGAGADSIGEDFWSENQLWVSEDAPRIDFHLDETDAPLAMLQSDYWAYEDVWKTSDETTFFRTDKFLQVNRAFYWDRSGANAVLRSPKVFFTKDFLKSSMSLTFVFSYGTADQKQGMSVDIFYRNAAVTNAPWERFTDIDKPVHLLPQHLLLESLSYPESAGNVIKATKVLPYAKAEFMLLFVPSEFAPAISNTDKVGGTFNGIEYK